MHKTNNGGYFPVTFGTLEPSNARPGARESLNTGMEWTELEYWNEH